jgi:tRNA-dihydrouridine synthase
VAQLWGRSPLKFEEAARIVADLGFDGIDINMGCPQDKEIKIGSCAALIREPQLAVEIIRFTKKGAGGLPVSVKTRLGYNENSIGTWLRHLLSANPAAITIHGRTRHEKSKVPADWKAIAEAVKIRDVMKREAGNMKQETLIIGNGDVKSRAEGLERVKETGVDGVMIGRGAFGNPWLFAPVGDGLKPSPTARERLSVMLEHARLFNELLGGQKSFVIMRKHFKAYASGFEGSHELRAKLLNTKDLPETEKIVENYLRLN